MTDSSQKVHLSTEEAEYVSRLTSEDDSFASLLCGHPDIFVNGRVITLSRPAAEMLRDYFTEKLARVGFDADYKPNVEGCLLERLIDVFFFPEAEDNQRVGGKPSP
jgi:hypothetical protein